MKPLMSVTEGNIMIIIILLLCNCRVYNNNSGLILHKSMKSIVIFDIKDEVHG